jgi:hypothetical protein
MLRTTSGSPAALGLAVSWAGLPAFEDSYRNYGERKLNRCLAGEFLEMDTDEILSRRSIYFSALGHRPIPRLTSSPYPAPAP